MTEMKPRYLARRTWLDTETSDFVVLDAFDDDRIILTHIPFSRGIDVVEALNRAYEAGLRDSILAGVA